MAKNFERPEYAYSVKVDRDGYVSGFGLAVQHSDLPVLIAKEHRDDRRFDKAPRSVPWAFVEPHRRAIADQQDGRELEAMADLGGLDWREIVGAVTERSPHAGALAAMPMLSVVRELDALLAKWNAAGQPAVSAAEERARKASDRYEAISGEPVMESVTLRADQFEIVRNIAAAPPFKIESGQVVINDDYLQQVSAGRIGAGEIGAETINVHGPLAVYGADGQQLLSVDGVDANAFACGGKYAYEAKEILGPHGGMLQRLVLRADEPGPAAETVALAADARSPAEPVTVTVSFDGASVQQALAKGGTALANAIEAACMVTRTGR